MTDDPCMNDDASDEEVRAAVERLESQFERAIEDYLTIELGPEGVGWFRMNAGAAAPVSTGDGELDALRSGRRIRLAPEGTADLLAILPAGRMFSRPESWDKPWPCFISIGYAAFLWIEVKRPGGGRPEKARAEKQRAFRECMQAIGCLAIEARSLDDVRAVLPPRRVR